jgi:hypothetical protein
MDMLTTALVIIVIFGAAAFMFIVIFVAAAFMLLEQRQDASSHPYTAKDHLFTAAERSFLGVLDKAIGDNARVFGQVRIADILSVRKGLSKSDRQTAQNKINSKHIDYIVCDSSTLRILCAIELNDKSHEKKKRIERDQFVESAFKAAGIPLLWIKARKGYSIEAIRSELRPHIKNTYSPETVNPNLLEQEQKGAL